MLLDRQMTMTKPILFLSALLFPLLSSAQTLDGAVQGFLGYVNQVIPVLIGLILLALFWSAATFIRTSGKGGEVEEAKKRLLWGVIALFISVAFWGIVQFFTSDFFGETPGFGAPSVNPTEINELFPDAPPRNDTQVDDLIVEI